MLKTPILLGRINLFFEKVMRKRSTFADPGREDGSLAGRQSEEEQMEDLSGRDSRRASVTGFKRLPAAGFVLKSWQKKGGTAIIRPLHTCMQRVLLFHRSFRRKRCFDYVHSNRQMEHIW